MSLTKNNRTLLLAYAIIAFFGPNGLYLYFSITQPDLNSAALENPVALAFMIEAMMLLSLFLMYVNKQTSSWLEVIKYLVLSFVGSLAFSFPLFLYLQDRKVSQN